MPIKYYQEKDKRTFWNYLVRHHDHRASCQNLWSRYQSRRHCRNHRHRHLHQTCFQNLRYRSHQSHRDRFQTHQSLICNHAQCNSQLQLIVQTATAITGNCFREVGKILPCLKPPNSLRQYFPSEGENQLWLMTDASSCSVIPHSKLWFKFVLQMVWTFACNLYQVNYTAMGDTTW